MFMQSAWFPIFLNQTVHLPWPLFVQEPWHLWMPVLKFKNLFRVLPWDLITDTKSGKYAILSDILGDEDHLGDMDFKVAGTRDGITATQMDIKVEGLTFEVLKKALAQAHDGRMHILDKLVEAIPEPRADYKPHVPRMVQITIPKELIGAVIGPGRQSYSGYPGQNRCCG